jgi:hypothetical protein
VIGRRHGPTFAYFPSGALRRVEHYEHGVPDGLFLDLAEDGEVLSTHVFWHGKEGQEVADPDHLCPSGSTRVRLASGDPELLYSSWTGGDACMVPENGRSTHEGPAVLFDWLSTCDHDTPDSPCFLDLSHGRIAKGFPGSPLVGWKPQPWIRWRGELHRDRLNGVARSWYAPGLLAAETSYRDGIREGVESTWYRNGRRRDQTPYIRGLPEGTRTFWSPDGTLRWRARYVKGRMLEAEGDLEIAGRHCPEGSAATTGEDGFSAECQTESDAAKIGRAAQQTCDQKGQERFDAPAAPFGPPSWPIAVRVKLDFDGKPFAPLLAAHSQLTVRDAADGAKICPEITYWNGELLLARLSAGRYYLVSQAQSPSSSPVGTPGAFEGDAEFDLAAERAAVVHVELHTLLHLTQPTDNTPPNSPPALASAPPVVARPVRLAWEGLGADTEYFYCLWRLRSSVPVTTAGQAMFRRIAATGRTTAAAATLDLPATRENEFYEVEIGAWRDGHFVGRLTPVRFQVRGEGPQEKNMGKLTPSLMVETLREAYAAFNRNDIPATATALDPQIEWTEPAAFPGGGTYHGHAGVQAYLSQSRRNWAE